MNNVNIFNYNNKNGEEYLEFNLSEFLRRQLIINRRFPNPLYKDGRKFSEVFDSFLIQLSEEVYEYNISLSDIEKVTNKNNSDYLLNSKEELNKLIDSSLEELIDGFMYYGSLFACLSEQFLQKNFASKNKIIKINLEKTRDKINNEYNNNINYFKEITLMSDLMKVDYAFIFYLRRLVGDRKYHKPAKEKFMEYKDNLLNELLKVLLSNIPSKIEDNKIEFINDFNKFGLTPLSPLWYMLVYCLGSNGRKVSCETNFCFNNVNRILNKKEMFLQNLNNN